MKRSEEKTRQENRTEQNRTEEKRREVKRSKKKKRKKRKIINIGREEKKEKLEKGKLIERTNIQDKQQETNPQYSNQETISAGRRNEK